jgi:hypothetical protein
MRYSYVFILGSFLVTGSFSPLYACDCDLKPLEPVLTDFN